MFEALKQAIEELEIPPWGDALVEALALRDRLDAAIASAVAAFDTGGGWELEGATSLTASLRHRGRQSGRDSARLASTARRLRKLPATAAAYGSGELSGGQVAAVVANLSDATVGVFADHEETLVPTVVPLEVREVARAMQLWRERAEALLDDRQEPADPPRALHHSQTLDGRWVTDGSFDPEGGSVIDAALGLAVSPEAEGEPSRSPPRRRGVALVDVCRWFLETTPVPRPDDGGPTSTWSST